MPVRQPPPILSLADISRFESKVTRPAHGCHLWAGGTFKDGYGRFYAHGADGRFYAYYAHRIAWLLRTGTYPAEYVLHRCDTPPCVRFECLFLGDDAANARDRDAKGRRTDVTKDRRLKKLTEAERDRIRNGTEGLHALARELGVSPSTVHRHRHRR